MLTRKPIVAGQFYSAGRDACIDEVEQCLVERKAGAALPESIVAGIVPHAGWLFSGSVAGLVFSAVKERHEKVDTFCIFGAAHSYFGEGPAAYCKGNWTTPLGVVDVDEELAEALLETGGAVSDPAAHSNEHSIEVQVPFIQYLFPEAKILPILVPPSEQAISLGEAIGGIINSLDKKVICIGSTDLTHYGPRYGFMPMGVGVHGVEWAERVNDRLFIDSALGMEPRAVLAGAAENYNACGPGAAAAAIAAAKRLGRKKGVLLAHTNSYEIMLEKMRSTSTDSVGYAAIVF